MTHSTAVTELWLYWLLATTWLQLQTEIGGFPFRREYNGSLRQAVIFLENSSSILETTTVHLEIHSTAQLFPQCGR